MSQKVPERPVWDEGVKWPDVSPLKESITADVAIIGGGLTGVVAAYLLSRAGYEVVILEKDKLGYGATGLTTAFLTQYIDTELRHLVDMFGSDKTKLVLEAHAAAIDMVEHVSREERIGCEFMRCSNYVYAHAENERVTLRAEEEAGGQLGLPLTYKEIGLPFAHHGYLELPNQAKFHPLKYLSALTHVLKARGVRIFGETAVEEIDGDTPVVIKSGEHTITAQHVLVATYAPFDKKLFFKKAFYTSYVLNVNLPREALPAAIFEDTANPYHYWRVDRGEQQDRLIFGGADHRSDIPVNKEKSWQALADDMRQFLSSIPYEIASRWDGPIIETVDGLAYIGPLENGRVFYATGFSGNGMTYAHIAAQLFSDHVQQKENPWQAVFSARRRPSWRALLQKGRDYSGELLGGAVRNTFRS